MRNKRILFLSILIFMIVLSIGAISAQNADNAIASSDDDSVLQDSEPDISGTVSGGVDVATENPWTSTGGKPAHGELNYHIPDNAKTIKSADVYVNIYSGSASNTWGADTNITIITDNGETKYNESLWINEGSTDGTIYIVNNHTNHTTKCYSDYMIHYNVTSLLTGLNGTDLKIKVDTFNMTSMNKTFDGRIKLIALVLAYDDDDDDVINYWVNANQLWSKTNTTLNFNTKGKAGITTLTNVVLSTTDGSYRINDKILADPETHTSGGYYQYNQWDVTKNMNKDKDTTLMVLNNGASVKNALSVLTIQDIKSTVSFSPEYTSVPSAYAGTNNTLTVKLTTGKSGKYTVRLLADGVVVDEIEVDLTNVSKEVYLTDPTIRDVNETTVNGATYNKVNYTVELAIGSLTINSTTTSLPILYNGYLGKDLAYPTCGMESLETIVINGDIIVDVKDDYLSSGVHNKTDVWTINLDENSTIVKSFVYIPYTWCKITETPDMFNVTFNGEKITPLAFYRDQSNLGSSSGGYGYGVYIYDVTSLINKSGNNTLFLNNNGTAPTTYSSAFVYMYNTTNSNYIKEVYINHGADLLYNSYNNANRPVKSDSTFNVNSKVTANATLYVFASNAKNNYTDLVFNGETYSNVFQAGSYQTVYKQLDVTGKIKDSNSVSVVSVKNKGTFLALQQIMVLTKNLDDVEITITPEYTSVPSAYAGTNNLLTITIEALKAGKFNATLLADGKEVNKTEIDLIAGTNTFKLNDPTIREVNASTVNGALNHKVNYTLQLSSGKNASVILPILYNGNLGKDLAYPAGGMESFLNITITGDIVIDIKDVKSYLGTSAMNRTDVWNISLDAKSSLVKSYIYVPYNWFNGKSYTENESMFNVTFNGVSIAPVAMYRDQGNLGTYGKYGYGVLVYDVTALTKNGENTLVLNKKYPTPAVYPSVMIYMYNTTGSAVVKNVYISNGADLLAGTSNNVAKRLVHADSTIDVAAIGDTAKLYVFAASAQNGEGNIVFNGNTYENVWNGTSSTTDLYVLDITNSIKDSNNISFVATGSTILALQQIIVTTAKAPIVTTIEAASVTVVYNTAGNLIAKLTDSNGQAIANATLTIALNGQTYNVTTDSNGQAKLAIPANLVPKTYIATITYNGDETHVKSSANANVIVKKANVKLTAKKKTFKAKKKTKKYSVTLKDNTGKAMSKVKLTLKIKGKKITAKTNAKGKATFKIKKLTKKGKYKANVIYKGDNCFNKANKKVKIIVKK